MTSHDVWADVDRYIDDHLVGSDPHLTRALEAAAAAGLPAIQVSPAQGKLLALLVGMTGARRVLEIGTLGGYSTIWLAKALPAGPESRVVTLEIEASNAAVARENFAFAGLSDRIDLWVGPALETLPTLEGQLFDLTFIDADKENIPSYLEWALRLSHVGSVIVIDNIVRQGQVIAGSSIDPRVHGARRAFQLIRDHPRLDATAIQTVGCKGYDGVIVARVVD